MVAYLACCSLSDAPHATRQKLNDSGNKSCQRTGDATSAATAAAAAAATADVAVAAVAVAGNWQKCLKT